MSLTASGKRTLRKVERMLDAAEPGVLAALTETERGELQQWAVRVLARQSRPGGPGRTPERAEPLPSLPDPERVRT